MSLVPPHGVAGGKLTVILSLQTQLVPEILGLCSDLDCFVAQFSQSRVRKAKNNMKTRQLEVIAFSAAVTREKTESGKKSTFFFCETFFMHFFMAFSRRPSGLP